jgi:hypothetical protein
LYDPGRPLDSHQIDIGCIPQTEVGFQETASEITISTAADLAHLPERAAPDGRFQPHFRANGRAIGHHPYEFEFNPAVAVPVVAIEQVCRLRVRAADYVRLLVQRLVHSNERYVAAIKAKAPTAPK